MNLITLCTTYEGGKIIETVLKIIKQQYFNERNENKNTSNV